MMNLSDRELYVECKKWGAAALAARRRFAGLLPEVQRRELAALAKGRSWLGNRGYGTIYEFAARLAGMSRDQVNRVLNVHEKLSGIPVLQSLLVNGEVSANKLERVIKIASVENQNDLAKKVQVLSQRAIEFYAKENKISNDANGSPEPQTFVHVHEKEVKQSVRMNVNQRLQVMQILSDEVLERLSKLSEKGHDVNKILLELLDENESAVVAELEQIAAEVVVEEGQRKETGRYIPVKVRRIVAEKYGDICSADGCGKQAEELHHERGFAKVRSHDPRFLKPLCKAHHELEHGGWKRFYVDN